MKKLLVIIITALIVLVPLGSLSYVKAETASPSAISVDELDALTQRLCEDFADRTSFTEQCREAAEGIKAILEENTSLKVEVASYTKTFSVLNGFRYVDSDYTSYNVVAAPVKPDSGKKTVLITTNFSNHYSDSELMAGVNAEGALYNAASTALLIKLAEELPKANNEYNFTFAFFSGTDEGNFGSEDYVNKFLSQDVMLVINLERIGCGYTYFYTDEAETEHGEFIKKQASGYENIKEFPTAGRVLLGMSTVDGLPYSHYAMRGDISPFLSVGKSCLNLIGGEFKWLSDSESKDVRLTYTGNDTYAKLKESYPDYAVKLSKAGEFIIELTAQAELEGVCLGAAQSYKIFTQGWIAYVIALGIIIILILVLIFISRHFEKKYPIPAPPKIKLAVFGTEYEDVKENEIAVDISRKENKDDVNPFDV